MTRESDIETYFTTAVERAGGEVRKVKWIGRRSALDRLMLLPGWGCFVEIKRPGKKPTEAQYREMARLRAAGLHVEWVSTYEEVDNLMLGVGK